MTGCSVVGCVKPSVARGMCDRHYRRTRRTGSPHATLVERRGIEAQFEKFTMVTSTGCVEWTGCRVQRGYGQISVNGKMRRAHRVAWEQRHGPIPQGLHVLHSCDNPPCVNVDHLSLGTHVENMAQMVERGRARSGHWGQLP